MKDVTVLTREEREKDFEQYLISVVPNSASAYKRSLDKAYSEAPIVPYESLYDITDPDILEDESATKALKETRGFSRESPGGTPAQAGFNHYITYLKDGWKVDHVRIEGGQTRMSSPYTLLMSNKQLIMNGAPGTGKTFSAMNEIADKLLGIDEKMDDEKKNEKEIRVGMVQFHPSYDYTDFIEGIRPTVNGEDVGYTLRNGAFKKFCRRAGVVERILSVKEEVSDDEIERFLIGEDKKTIDFWKDYISKIGGRITTNSFSDEQKKSLPPFLFIIDEINRAEISKVLGEVMFCLDADYRGSKGKIATQYSSLATEESFFIDENDDKFFVPSNVYIIGTMNDIDRSVEVFDFAMRRRFAWHEVSATSVMDTVLRSMGVEEKLGADYEDYLARITEVNNAIVNQLKLNRNYHLGPSYFAKIELYLDEGYYEAREFVWNNHINQILREYVKGKKIENIIDQIHVLFCD